MSVLRALAINAATLLSLLWLASCVFVTPNQHHPYNQPSHSENYMHHNQLPLKWYIANATGKPTWIVRGPGGLPLPLPNTHPPKCMREVPAVFFQHEKDVPVAGNSTLNPAFNLVEVCCKGYKRYDYDWSRCVPDCGERCKQNGFCLEGGICQCFDEFVLNYRNECVSTCPLGCPDGVCYLNGTCICDRGFALDPTHKFCVPECDPVCGHKELCVATDVCECIEGYRNSTLGCQPVCIPDCAYGHCVAPNECECFPPYTKRINGTICESICYKTCENGFCANSTTCVCQSGYKFESNTSSCLPDCDDNCENGVCIAPSNCRCFNGYQRNGLKCDAICERGCGFYGTCIGPDVCGCAIVDGPFKTYQKCRHGSCNGLGRCRCAEGKTRFIDQCLSPDEVTTYASVYHDKLNQTLLDEFQLLIGRHFLYVDSSRPLWH